MMRARSRKAKGRKRSPDGAEVAGEEDAAAADVEGAEAVDADVDDKILMHVSGLELGWK